MKHLRKFNEGLFSSEFNELKEFRELFSLLIG